MSAVLHGARRQHFCVRCHTRYKNMVMGKGSASHVVAETMETRTRVKELQGKAGSLAGRDSSKRRRRTLNKIDSMPSEQSLPDWPSFLEKMCERDGVVLEALYLMFTFEPL